MVEEPHTLITTFHKLKVSNIHLHCLAVQGSFYREVVECMIYLTFMLRISFII